MPVRARHALVALFLTFLAFAAPNNEQNISGTVSDVAGKPLEGAVVQLQNAKTHAVWSRVTDGDGRYRFAGLHTPQYTDYKIRAVYKGKASGQRRVPWTKSGKETSVDISINVQAED